MSSKPFLDMDLLTWGHSAGAAAEWEPAVGMVLLLGRTSVYASKKMIVNSFYVQ